MRYYVLDDTGNQYGPADLPTLQEWIRQNRLAPHTRLRNEMTGETVMAVELRDLVFPAPGSPASPQAVSPQPGSEPYANYQRPGQNFGTPVETTTTLVFAILSTLFCCTPVGIGAIVFASKAMSSNTGGNYEEAHKNLEIAKKWIYGSVAMYLVGGCLYFIFVVGIGAAGGFK